MFELGGLLARARRHCPRVALYAVGIVGLAAGWQLTGKDMPASAAAAEWPILAPDTHKGLADQWPAGDPTGSGLPRIGPLAAGATDSMVVSHGRLNGSVYASTIAAGASSEMTRQIVKLFSHKGGPGRDLRRGDEFRLVFERPAADGAGRLRGGDLLYAEFEAEGRPVRFYRYEGPGAPGGGYFDSDGNGMRGFLLSAPVNQARVTSVFGMRRHPILGFNRMHQGVDLGARLGTPVLAAGEGVVVEASRNGGYGNWIKVRHADGWETGYGHLARYARGVEPGRRVAQGQVIGYVGSTGRSTGPHLHYEIWRNGRQVNPRAAGARQAMTLTGRDLELFRAQKESIDRLVANSPGAAQTPRLAMASLKERAGAPETRLGLRRGA